MGRWAQTALPRTSISETPDLESALWTCCLNPGPQPHYCHSLGPVLSADYSCAVQDNRNREDLVESSIVPGRRQAGKWGASGSWNEHLLVEIRQTVLIKGFSWALGREGEGPLG